MKKLLVILGILTISLTLASCKKATTTTNTQEQSQKEDEAEFASFPSKTEKKSAHFVESSPFHGESLNVTPEQISINFNFDLGTGSKISVTRKNTEYSQGQATISEDKRTLSKKYMPGLPGVYDVNYTACWPDGTCHDGLFQFAIKQ